MILGIIILAAVAGLIMFFSPSEKLELDFLETSFSRETKPAIVSFIENCVEEKLEEAIEIAGLQGGQVFYNEDSFLITEEKDFGYFYQDGGQIIDKGFVEKELAGYIDVFLNECIQNFSVFSNQSYKIVATGISSNKLDFEVVSNELISSNIKHHSKALIQPTFVRLDLDYPLTISRPEDRFDLNTFTVKIPSQLGEALELAEEVVNKQNVDGMINLEYLSGFEPFIKTFPYSGERTIYSFYYGDDYLPRSFIFAIDNPSNAAPQFRPLPQTLFMTKGKTFVMQVKAYDPDNHKMFFSTDKKDFPISQNGWFNFTPSFSGEFNLTITVSDSQGLKTEKNVKVAVKTIKSVVKTIKSEVKYEVQD